MSSNSTLGKPDLVLGPLSLWVHSYQFATATHDSDANWLFATARCDADGATVRATGAFLMTSDLDRFREQCETLYKSLQGEAALDPLEPELRVTLRYFDKAGHLEGRVQITPDHLSQRHEFDFGLDQSYLPSIVAACGGILQRFPIREVEGARGA